MGFSWYATLPLTSALTAEVYGLKHEMVNESLGFGFSHFGVEQGGVSSFREFFMLTTAA
jgi:hypothetical protein